MEIPIELFHRLSEQDLSLISPERDIFKQGKEMVTLKQPCQLAFETGSIVAGYIIKLDEVRVFEWLMDVYSMVYLRRKG